MDWIGHQGSHDPVQVLVLFLKCKVSKIWSWTKKEFILTSIFIWSCIGSKGNSFTLGKVYKKYFLISFDLHWLEYFCSIHQSCSSCRKIQANPFGLGAKTLKDNLYLICVVWQISHLLCMAEKSDLWTKFWLASSYKASAYHRGTICIWNSKYI